MLFIYNFVAAPDSLIAIIEGVIPAILLALLFFVLPYILAGLSS
jgi:hypothetical protein